MNKMNGGYVMVAYNASQSELEKAYATKRPVIVYDADNIGHYAQICIDASDNYYVKTLKGALLRHSVELKKGTTDQLTLIVYTPETKEIDTLDTLFDVIDEYGGVIPTQVIKVSNVSANTLFGYGSSHDDMRYISVDNNDVMSAGQVNLEDWPSDTSINDTIAL